MQCQAARRPCRFLPGLTKTASLVRQTALSLTEVALACGFASNSHFSREYRKHFATTPAADRRFESLSPYHHPVGQGLAISQVGGDGTGEEACNYDQGDDCQISRRWGRDREI